MTARLLRQTSVCIAILCCIFVFACSDGSARGGEEGAGSAWIVGSGDDHSTSDAFDPDEPDDVAEAPQDASPGNEDVDKPTREDASDTFQRDDTRDRDVSTTPDGSDGDSICPGSGAKMPPPQWVETIQREGTDNIADIVQDQNGFIYVAGQLSGSVADETYGGGASDAFVAMYRENGDRAWIRLLGEKATDRAVGITSAPFGPIHVVWNTNLTSSEATGVEVTSLARSDGTIHGTYTPDNANADMLAHDITASNANHILVTGRVDSGAFGQRGSGDTDAFVANLQGGVLSIGGRRWIRVQGTSGPDHGIAVDGPITRPNRGVSWLVASNLGGSTPATIELFDVSQKGNVQSLDVVGQGGLDVGDTWAFGLVSTMTGPLIAGTSTPPTARPQALDALVAGYDRGNNTWRFRTHFGSNWKDLAVDVDRERSGALWATGMLYHDRTDDGPASEAYLARLEGNGRCTGLTRFGGSGVTTRALETRGNDQPLYVGGGAKGLQLPSLSQSLSPAKGKGAAAFLVKFDQRGGG